MAQRPRLTLNGLVLHTPDPPALARFYSRLLGWPVDVEEPGWVTLRPPGDGPKLSFHLERPYRRPVWPSEPAAQQAMAHLDIAVDDLAAAGAAAAAAGAVLADFQPQDDVRVYLDPHGHPFCLFEPGG